MSIGQTIRITPPGWIEIPGVITVQGDRFETKGAVLREEGTTFLTVEAEQHTLHVPRPGTRPVGKLAAADPRTITILREGRTFSIPREAIGKVEVRRAKGHSILPGAILGAGLGFAIGHASCGPEVPILSATPGTCGAMAAIPAAVIGGWAGAVIGGDRWQAVPSERLSVSVTPRHDGAALVVTLGF